MRKRILSFALALLLIFTMVPHFPIEANAAQDYYKDWAQGDSRWGSIRLGSSSETVASAGCLVTAVTKLIIQCGLRDASSFNVATLVNWLNSKGGFTSSGELYYGYPASMVSGLKNQGYLMDWGTYSSSSYNDRLLNYIRNGYHMSINVNNGGHWVAVDEAMSLATGQIHIMDSWKNGPNSGVLLADRYSTFNKVHAYKGGSTPSVAQEPEKPVLNTSVSGSQVTFSWAGTANTTHYELRVDKKNSSGGWESVESISNATSGLTRTLADGEYRARLASYNSNGWTADGSDWLHTWADDVFFTIDQSRHITYYDAYGNVWETGYASVGDNYGLLIAYPTLEGHYFSGWAFDPNATVYDIRPGETITVDGDISLYPVYVSHEEAISGEPVLIYNIEDFTADGYDIEETEKTIYREQDTGYWTDWSAYSIDYVAASDTVEVRTTPMYRYYYFYCSNCGGREPFWGKSDCGATIPENAWHVVWSAIPYTQCNYQTYDYTTSKYYTTSLGDGLIWNFSAGNLYDTAIGTMDAGGDTVVITTGYSSRTYVKQTESVGETVYAYQITPAVPTFPLNGTCGSNVNWVLEENGTLTISGTGAMEDFAIDGMPWYAYRDYITKVVICEGVTSIGNYAFYQCVNLTSVEIPESVTAINKVAFCDCTRLTDLVIPASVTSIGASAFASCAALTDVVIPDGITSIEVFTFALCSNLRSISIPDSVTNIKNNAFASCENLTDVYYGGTQSQKAAITLGSINDSLSAAQWHYSSVDGGTCGSNVNWVLEENGTLTISGTGAMTNYDRTYGGIGSPWYPYKDRVKTVIIKSGVTSIGSDAFNDCSNLTSVTIPNSVTRIGYGAFCNAVNLVSITIPDSVQGIDGWVFYGCSSLESVELPKDLDVIRFQLFANCGSLTDIEIPDGVIGIEGESFFACSSLTGITIPDSVTYIGERAFEDCEKLMYITIPDSVTKIDSAAFWGCYALQHILYTGTQTQWDKIEVYWAGSIGIETHFNATGDEILNFTHAGENMFYCEICDKHYDEDGQIVTFAKDGWVKENNRWTYYEHGSKVTDQWVKDGSKWCYLGTDGYMVTDKWVKDGSKWCYVDKYGYMVTDKWVKDGSQWCYINKHGYMVTNGWAKDGANGWCFMNQHGYITYDKWVNDGKGWSYVDKNGYMVTNKWVKDGSKWCYIGADGYQVFNTWAKDAGKWCYIGSDGYQVFNTWAKDGNKWCYIGSDGYQVFNTWAKDGSKWCYIGSDGYQVFNTWAKDGSKWCYIGSDGYQVFNTWAKDGSKWCYLDANGYQVFNKWVKDGKYWAYIGSDGYMATNKWIDNGSSWSYVDANGHALTGTHTIDGKKYTFDANGEMPK